TRRHLQAVACDSGDVRCIRAGESEVAARLERRHTGQAPASERAPGETLEFGRTWQFVNPACGEAVIAVEVAGAVTLAPIMLIAVVGSAGSQSLHREPIGIQAAGEGVRSQKLQPLAEAFSKAGFKAVVPRAATGFDLPDAVEGRESLVRNTLIDIGRGVGRHSANGA